MLCPPGRPLNASATGAGLPDAHRDRPSREAGSFFDHFRLDERAGFGEDQIAQICFPRLCRTLRPAPQAGCFVSRLSASKDSAQITLRHRAFRTVALTPSSASLDWPSF